MSCNRSDDAEKYKDYPESVVFDGAVYSVEVDRDSDGEIQYLQLIDANNEFFFEIDWVGAIDHSTILALLEEEKRSEAIGEKIDAEHESADHGSDLIVDAEAEEVSRLINDFDFLFPDYSSYPVEFKVELMENLEKNYSDESFQFKRIFVSEAAEYWDDDE